jgi:hypothetical protein
MRGAGLGRRSSPTTRQNSAAWAAGVLCGTGVRWHSGNDAAARRHSAFCASVAAAAATGFG